MEKLRIRKDLDGGLAQDYPACRYMVEMDRKAMLLGARIPMSSP